MTSIVRVVKLITIAYKSYTAISEVWAILQGVKWVIITLDSLGIISVVPEYFKPQKTLYQEGWAWVVDHPYQTAFQIAALIYPCVAVFQTLGSTFLGQKAAAFIYQRTLGEGTILRRVRMPTENSHLSRRSITKVKRYFKVLIRIAKMGGRGVSAGNTVMKFVAVSRVIGSALWDTRKGKRRSKKARRNHGSGIID